MTDKQLKEHIFSLIVGSSRSIIEGYLHKLSIDINVSYNDIVKEFNEFDNHWWGIEYE